MTRTGQLYNIHYKRSRVLTLRGAITWAVFCAPCVQRCRSVDERGGSYRALVLNGNAMQRERRK